MWIGTHIGIKGFPKFQVHVGYEYQEISRSFTPLRIFRCWWSPNVIHCMALLVNDYCMTNGVKSTLICLKVFWCTEKEELENILQNVFCSMQLANVKWRQLRIDKNLSKRYTYKLHDVNSFVLRVNISCLSVNVCLISLVSKRWVKTCDKWISDHKAWWKTHNSLGG